MENLVSNLLPKLLNVVNRTSLRKRFADEDSENECLGSDSGLSHL